MKHQTLAMTKAPTNYHSLSGTIAEEGKIIGGF